MVFKDNLTENTDRLLIEEALAGNKKSLEKLVKKYQDYIYNVALRLFLDPDDALDATQEVLIKVVTHLKTFKGESNFKTWLYRIVFNHFLNTPKRKMELVFANKIDLIGGYSDDDGNEYSEEEIEEVRILCSTAMLMCLDREQRLPYVVGEIFDTDHTLGAELFETTPANYRVKLHRAKTDLKTFVTGKCGILNPKNTCRCPKKTRLMVEQKIVDKENLKFNISYINKISEIVEQKREALSDEIQLNLQHLFRDSPFQIKNKLDELIEGVIK